MKDVIEADVMTKMEFPDLNKKKDRPTEYSCKECRKSFDDALSLKCHVNSDHRGIRYPCDYCEYLGPQIKTVKRHIDSYHPGFVNRYKNISEM